MNFEIEQRYELAALLCEGLRVLDLGEATEAARRPLAAAAAELIAGGDVPAGGERFGAVVCLAGEAPDLERLTGFAREGARVLAAFEHRRERARTPRAEPSAADRAQALAEQLGDAIVLPQFFTQGALIGLPDGAGAPLALVRGDARPEDAAALIVASGFEPEGLSHAHASLRVTAEPVLSSYIRRLEAAHAELLRANRMLMLERVGQSGSGAASLLEARRQADEARRQLAEMERIAKGHELQALRIQAWYDAPRYHLVDRVRGFLTRVPGFTGFVRFLWSLVSTRAETPNLDAAAKPEPDDGEGAQLAELTREREGRKPGEDEGEPSEVTSRLEQ